MPGNCAERGKMDSKREKTKAAANVSHRCRVARAGPGWCISVARLDRLPLRLHAGRGRPSPPSVALARGTRPASMATSMIFSATRARRSWSDSCCQWTSMSGTEEQQHHRRGDATTPLRPTTTTGTRGQCAGVTWSPDGGRRRAMTPLPFHVVGHSCSADRPTDTRQTTLPVASVARLTRGRRPAGRRPWDGARTTPRGR